MSLPALRAPIVIIIVEAVAMSRFDAMRAHWESTYHHRSDDSPTIPLLHNENDSKTTFEMDRAKPHHTIPGHGRRLTAGFGDTWNKPLSTIKNKAFSRASKHASSESAPGRGGHTRQSSSAKSVGQGSTKPSKRNEKMARSQTTSFLPVPSKVRILWVTLGIRADHVVTADCSFSAATDTDEAW